MLLHCHCIYLINFACVYCCYSFLVISNHLGLAMRCSELPSYVCFLYPKLILITLNIVFIATQSSLLLHRIVTVSFCSFL